VLKPLHFDWEKNQELAMLKNVKRRTGQSNIENRLRTISDVYWQIVS